MRFKEIKKHLESGDVFLSRLTHPILKHISIFVTGTHIGHNSIVLNEDQLIEATLGDNIVIKDLKTLTEGIPYVHVYKLKKIYAENLPNILKNLKKYYNDNIHYGALNAFGHLTYNLIMKTRIKRISKKHAIIDKSAFLYNHKKTTCSQMLFRAIEESLNIHQKKIFQKQLQGHDIRSFFPTQIPLISDYKFTAFFNPYKILKLSSADMKKLDRRFII